MREQKAKQYKGFWGRLAEMTLYAGHKVAQTFWPRNILCLILSSMVFFLIVLVFGAGCFECLRHLGCEWSLRLQIRACSLGNFLANAVNCLAGWMASIFCIPKEGGLSLSISASQLYISAEASSLSFAPAQVILTTLGTGGTTLSAISEFRARRFLGVSMRDVMRRYYPWHVCFMAMHILLYLLGMYSLEQELVRSSMLALFGLFLCSVYAVFFSVGAFSAERLTIKYIGGITKRVTPDSAGHRASLISNIAFHIGKEYSENSRALRDWFKSYCIMFSTLIDGAQEHRSPETPVPALFDHVSWDESAVFKKCFYSTKDPVCSNPAYHVIYNLNASNLRIRSFSDKINVAQLAWKNLFYPFDDDAQGKAEVAAAILTASYIYSYPHFLVMVCGLSLYQHNVDPSKSTGPSRSAFLWQVLKQSQFLQQELCDNSTWIKNGTWMPRLFACSHDEWAPYRKVLGLTELSVTLWEYTLYGMDPLEDRKRTYNALLEIADFSDYDNMATLRQEARLYMAYGYITYLNAMPLSQLRPPRAALAKLLRIFEINLYQKIRNIN